jgi:hypothetical protein
MERGLIAILPPIGFVFHNSHRGGLEQELRVDVAPIGFVPPKIRIATPRGRGARSMGEALATSGQARNRARGRRVDEARKPANCFDPE